MKHPSRREFLKLSGLATAGTMLIPQFLKAFENPFQSQGDRNLIVLQLSGGNDGLNTIIPYRNDMYYQARPKIAVRPARVLKISGELGFNNALEKLRSIFDQGYLSIINNVGYPNPDRSHFRSMDIWQSASSSTEYINTGWVGRYLDANCDGMEHNAIEIDDTLSLALKGTAIKSMALKDPEKLYRATHTPLFKEVAENQPSNDDLMVSYLYKTAIATVSSAAYLFDKVKVYKPMAEYPKTEFGSRLKTIGTLINAGVDTKVYYAALSGFDTHVNQAVQQERLLATYAEGVTALVKDLETSGNWGRTLIVTFSEFGRRVSENASGGTDHGTANNLFIMGKNLKQPGFLNGTPDLKDLDEGDLRYQIDFRSVYATVLSKWMGVDSQKILGENFPTLSFI